MYIFQFFSYDYSKIAFLYLSLFSKILFKACLHSLIIPVTMSSLFPPAGRPTGTSLSSCCLHPPCHHLILFLRYPPINHKLQPTAATAVTAAIATADYNIVRPHRNRCKEDNIVVAIVLACGVLLVVVVDCSPASTTMGPPPSFSSCDGD